MRRLSGGPSGYDSTYEFRDHAEKFKGKTVKLHLQVTDPAASGGGPSLWNHLGEPVDFFAHIGEDVMRLKIILPEDANAVVNEPAKTEVVVTFVCEQGKHDEGNRATKVTRH